jgi:predicted O-linked N-acetylglucosamine transferase (SPINDLY family)/Fe2+ or Zn2+ uptake regulation protein
MGFRNLIKPLTLRFRESKDLWLEAEAAAEKGKHFTAESIYRELSKRRPDSPESHVYSSLSEYRLNKLEAALNILEAGLEKYPEAELMLEHYYRICAEGGQLDRFVRFIGACSANSAQFCEALFNMKSVDSAARINLIDSFLTNGLIHLAEQGINSIQARHRDLTALWSLSDVLLQRGRDQDAYAIYRQLSRNKPESPEDYLYSALADYRLKNAESAFSKFESGLARYPEAEYLFEHYFRICAECEQLDRVIGIMESEATNREQACEKLFNMDFVDSATRVCLIGYCLKTGLAQMAENNLRIILEGDCPLVTLWKLSDVLLQHGRDDEAKSIYQELSKRQSQNPEDYVYSGLAELRLENTEKCFEILELGMKAFPNSEYIFNLYIELCAVRYEFDRYSRFMKESVATTGTSGKSALDFYRLAIKLGAPESFAVSFKDLEFKCDASDFSLLKDEFLKSLHNNRPPLEKAKLLLFFCRYLDASEDFTSRLFDILKESVNKQNIDSEEKINLLEIFYNLTMPMIPHYAADSEKHVREFISSSWALAASPAELDEPIRDMTKNWEPWQCLFCAATPHLYKDAISAFEQVAFKAWPKLNYTAPHIYKYSDSFERKIRIGFTVHDSMPMMSGLMSRLDRNIFETVFLRPGKAGQSPAAKSWIAGADKTIEYSDTNAYAAIKTFAEQELDIIVSGPSIAAIFYPLMARLAPLQMVLLEPNWTDGLTNSDYYISWQMAEPEKPADFYNSRVSFLQHPPYWIEKPSLSANDPASEEAKFELRQRVLGRGPESRIYLCANTPPKIHPKMDDIFLRLLEKDLAATLVILRGEYPPAKSLKLRLREKLGRHYERVVFLPTLKKDDAHRLLISADCCLDSYPLCGMSSSFDGAMLGVPIVTLPSDIPFGRWTAAIYEYIGVSGLTAKDREDYIDIAMKLATDKEWRNQKSMEIKRKAVRYIESQASFNEFQDFIIHAWKRKQSGLPPANWLSGSWQ